MAEIILHAGLAPEDPGAGKVTLYAKTDKLLYSKDDTGLETLVSGGAGGGGGGILQLATLTLDNADILALPTTAIEIVAAPGAGKILVPFHALLRMTYVGFTNGIDANAKLAIVWGSVFDGNSLDILKENIAVGGKVSNLIASGNNAHALLSFQQEIDSGNTYPLLNGGVSEYSSGLFLWCSNNGAGDFTDGDVGNELNVYVWYTELTL